MRVHITPTWSGDDKGDGGIRRVADAQLRYLHEFDIQVTDDPHAADLIACHGAAKVDAPGVPLVTHSHGMLWEDYDFGNWGESVNAQLIELMVSAQAITAPSQWVAHAIARGMLAQPEVIYHGVEVDDWAHDQPHLGYVLWNKARIDPVSDPRDMQRVAQLLPDVKFLTTYGRPTRNVLPMGVGTYEQMKPVVQRAGVYLATTRETFGIGTIEALAAGVPIVGWDYGGQHEIVIHNETGILVPFGDIEGLADALRRVLSDRGAFSAAARRDAVDRWGWQDKIAQYAALYQRTVQAWQAPRPKVSVVITAYNLAHYLPDALGSVLQQTMRDWECLIVDDCSTDNTQPQVAGWAKAAADPRFRYERTPRNLGLSGARNYGWQHAHGRYILFLDADDVLAPNALDTLTSALDRDPSIHIAYGSLDLMAADGSNVQRNPWPRAAFNWHAQLSHLNQLTYCALMRREVLERSGGYRTRDWRAEDASFWSRVTSFGFRAAKVTDDTVLIYRMHDAQKSRGESGDGDWTAWFPWRLAGDAQTGLEAMRAKRQPNAAIVPFGAQGTPPIPHKAWPVRHFQHPVISIVIPVGPGHAPYLIDALDSVQAQTFVEWEAIVVNDSGSPLDRAGSPWARVIDAGGLGAGAARNVGLRAARAPFVLFLDADDLITPLTLELLLRGHIEGGGRYAYSDWLTLEDEARIDGPAQPRATPDYDARRMLHQLFHAVTALIPTDWARAVGGFDERLPVFEDWDFYARLAVAGYHGHRVAQPLLIYRAATGRRTRAAIRAVIDDVPHYTDLGEQTIAAIHDRFAPYIAGEEPIMACCSNGPLAVASAALDDIVSFATAGLLASPADAAPGTVRLEFIGDQWGAQSYIGKVSGQIYRAGRDPHDRFHDVDPRDAEYLLSKRDEGNNPYFRLVVPTPSEPPELAEVGADAPPSRVKGRRR